MDSEQQSLKVRVVQSTEQGQREFNEDAFAFLHPSKESSLRYKGIVAFIAEKDNAVEDFRTLIGATNPQEAAEGTVRKLFAKDISANAIHGSDSDENAKIEAAFFFSSLERLPPLSVLWKWGCQDQLIQAISRLSRLHK